MKENVLERNARMDTDRKIADFRVKQQMDYAFKVKYARIRAWEFYNHPDVAGNCYVAVGGLDSITLLLFLRSIGIDVPAVSVSSLEDKSIQSVHKQLGVQPLKPLKSKVEVLREYGWPVISKEVAGKISLLQNPSEKNATVRHAIITGETGAYGGYRTGTRMKLAQKWLELFGGYENEREDVNYMTPDFLVSDKCCYYLKEKPCNDYAKETGCFPYMGLMASEGGRRQKALMMHGCNYISAGTKRSCPFAIFSRQDLLQLALDLQVPVPEIYGEIARDAERNAADNESAENWVQYVRLWHTHGETSASVRPALGAEPERMGNVDEPCHAGRSRELVRLGSRAGLYRRRVARPGSDSDKCGRANHDGRRDQIPSRQSGGIIARRRERMRITTDTPKNNLEMALNLFYVKDKEVWVREYGKNGADISLLNLTREILSYQCPYVESDISDDDLIMMMPEWLFDDVRATEHVIGLLYQAAWVCAELREHLKEFEDKEDTRMKKLFISQPMQGKSKEEILAERKAAICQAKEAVGDEVEIIDSYFENAPACNRPLWFLGESLKLLATADIAYFATGWEGARGCKIEHICAEEYGVHIIEAPGM
ncbi:MAG: hypothetical protein ACLS3C_01895 [Oscillospiraceae bacterium]